MDDGVPFYSWGQWPEHLLTKKQMGEAGFQTGKKLPPPAGAVRRAKSPGGVMWLYDRHQGVPKKAVSPEQRDHLDQARKKAIAAYYCERCGAPLGGWYPPGRRVCRQCRREQRIAEDHADAIEQARAWLNNDQVVILDTETTGLYDAEIVEIAVISASGATLLNTLVRCPNPEKLYETGSSGRSAYDIHGIGRDEIAAAPTWRDLYPQLRALLAGSIVVIYNAKFDWPIIQSACKCAHLAPLQVAEVACAMELYAQFVGDWSDYWGNYRWQPLNGGHRALGDCQATLRVLQRMGGQVAV